MLSAQYRFHGRRSLTFVLREGKTYRRKMISLKCADNSRRQTPRVAVVVGRKVSKIAPVRNRIRRRIYEVVRLHFGEIAGAKDMVFFVYDDSVATVPYGELESIVTSLIEEANDLPKIS